MKNDIDIKNSYIVNDFGELRKLWYQEAVRQGCQKETIIRRPVEWYDLNYCYIIPLGMSTGDCRPNGDELTLADFKQEEPESKPSKIVQILESRIEGKLVGLSDNGKVYYKNLMNKWVLYIGGLDE